MKIGIVASPWVSVPPSGYGGTEAVIDQLARGFAAAGHDVMLCTTGDSTCPVSRRHTFEHAQGERIGQATTELRHVIAAYRTLAGWGADVVHDHTNIGPFYAEAAPPAIRPRRSSPPTTGRSTATSSTCTGCSRRRSR